MFTDRITAQFAGKCRTLAESPPLVSTSRLCTRTPDSAGSFGRDASTIPPILYILVVLANTKSGRLTPSAALGPLAVCCCPLCGKNGGKRTRKTGYVLITQYRSPPPWFMCETGHNAVAEAVCRGRTQYALVPAPVRLLLSASAMRSGCFPKRTGVLLLVGDTI